MTTSDLALPETPQEARPVVTAWDRSPTIGTLTARLAEAQREFPSIEKDLTARVSSRRTGETYSYAYTDLATYLARLRPVLAQHGIAVLQFPTVEPGWVSVRTMLAVGDEWIASTLSLPWQGAPPDPQAIGSLITYARRYGFAAMVGVAPAQEDDDAGAAVQVLAQRDVVAPPPAREMPAVDARSSGDRSAAAAKLEDRRRLFGAMRRAGWSEARLRAYLRQHYGTTSIAALTPAQLAQVTLHLNAQATGGAAPAASSTPASDDDDVLDLPLPRTEEEEPA